VYPCHAVVVAMQANNGQQKLFVGHTDKVSVLTAVLLCSPAVVVQHHTKLFCQFKLR